MTDHASISTETGSLIQQLRDWERICTADNRAWDAHLLARAALLIENLSPSPEPALPQTDDIRVVCDDLREHGFPAYATLIGSLQAHIIALESRRAPEPADRMRELEAIAVAAGEVSLAWESDETEEFVEASDRLIVALRPWRERRAGSLSTTKVEK